jgi:hypothetical protein
VSSPRKHGEHGKVGRGKSEEEKSEEESRERKVGRGKSEEE